MNFNPEYILLARMQRDMIQAFCDVATNCVNRHREQEWLKYEMEDLDARFNFIDSMVKT